MQTVVLVGTSHKFQRPVDGPDTSGAAQFRCVITDVCLQLQIAAIAEEMSLPALHEWGVTESVAQQICASLELRHQFSDPSPQERYALGILQDNEIRIGRVLEGWGPEEIEIDVRARGSGPSDRIREQFWLRKIQEFDAWPLLFICGAGHFTSFSTLLRASGIDVVEVDSDWEPSAS